MKPVISNSLCWLWQGQYTQDLIRKFQWTLPRHLINSIQLQMSKDVMIFRKTRGPGQRMASEAGPHLYCGGSSLTWPGQQAAPSLLQLLRAAAAQTLLPGCCFSAKAGSHHSCSLGIVIAFNQPNVERRGLVMQKCMP